MTGNYFKFCIVFLSFSVLFILCFLSFCMHIIAEKAYCFTLC